MLYRLSYSCLKALVLGGFTQGGGASQVTDEVGELPDTRGVLVPGFYPRGPAALGFVVGAEPRRLGYSRVILSRFSSTPAVALRVSKTREAWVTTRS